MTVEALAPPQIGFQNCLIMSYTTYFLFCLRSRFSRRASYPSNGHVHWSRSPSWISIKPTLVKNCRKTNLQFREAMGNFIKFVDDSMERFVNQKLRMKRFKIFMTILDDHSVSALDKWIALAVNSQVEDLNLSLGWWPLEYYKVPQLMYSAACLKALSLCGCKLQYPSTIKLDSLKKQSLEHVRLDDDRFLDRFFECFPYIEDLTLEHTCSSSERLHISSLRSLKRVYLWSVDIRDQDFDGMIANSTKLERLDVFYCDKLARLKIPPSTQFQLSELVIAHCQKVEEVEVDAPKLKTFRYSGKPLSSFILSAPLCDAARLYFDDFTFNEWINFLSSLVNCKGVYLDLKFSSPEITLKRLRKVSLPARWRIEKLELDVSSPPSNYSAIFISMLVSCKPKILCGWKGFNSKSVDFIKYLYCRLKKGAEDCSNSKPCHVKCWRHQLKDVKFTNCIGSPRNWDEFSVFCSKLEKYVSFYFRLQWKSNETATPSKLKQRAAVSRSNENSSLKGERADVCDCFRFISSFPFLKFLKRMEECPEDGED